MSNEIIVQQDGVALKITLNRPDAGNGVSNDMAAELGRLLERAHETSQFVILRGAGNDFCTGRAHMGPPAGSPEAYELRNQNEVIFDSYGAFRRSPIPIVGVVQGRALGFGCALAASCDITIAADTAQFQLPEMGHNIMPTMAMSSLVDRVPRKQLMYLTYSTKLISAQQAMIYGFVSDVAPAAQLDQEVEKLCAALAKAPRPATLAVKEYARTAPGMDAQGAVDFARNLHSLVNSSSLMKRKH
jgi:enoyl-CoA hydratase